MEAMPNPTAEMITGFIAECQLFAIILSVSQLDIKKRTTSHSRHSTHGKGVSSFLTGIVYSRLRILKNTIIPQRFSKVNKVYLSLQYFFKG